MAGEPQSASNLLVMILRQNPLLLQDIQQRLYDRTFWSCTPLGCIVPADNAAASRQKVSVCGTSYSFTRVVAAWKWCHDPRLQTQPFQKLQASHLCHNFVCVNASHICVETQEANDARVACSFFGSSIQCPHIPRCIVTSSVPIPSMSKLLETGSISIASASLHVQAANAVLKAEYQRLDGGCLLSTDHCALLGFDQRCKSAARRCPERFLKASCLLYTFGTWFEEKVDQTTGRDGHDSSCSQNKCHLNSLTLSHRCGNPLCFSIGHVVQEQERLNLSRKSCHYHRDAGKCFHQPPCILRGM